MTEPKPAIEKLRLLDDSLLKRVQHLDALSTAIRDEDISLSQVRANVMVIRHSLEGHRVFLRNIIHSMEVAR